MDNVQEKNGFRYKAFISYRHQAPDQQIAKRLHTLIETYRIPSGIRETSGISSMGKVFRDQEELPLSSSLSDDIHEALEQSEWLICICSPRYLQSKWCLEELNYYIKLGRRDHILTILAEGEPAESFPEQLRFETVNGKTVENEPLAADVRASGILGSMRRLSNEKLRIMAPMLSVSYDDLRQRARIRRTRAVSAVSFAAVSLLSGFLIYAVSKNRQISRQRNIAVDNQMKLLIEQSIQSSENGNKLLAVNQLLQARDIRETVGTVNDGRFSAALEYALYDEPFGTVLTIDTNNRNLGELVFSHNDKYLSGITNLNSAVLIDATTGSILHTVSQSDTGMLDSVGFTLDDRYFFTVDSWYGFVSVYSVETGELYRRYDGSGSNAMNIGEKAFPMSGDRLLIIHDRFMVLWDYKNDSSREILPCGDLPFEGYIRPFIVDLAPDEKSVVIGSHGYGAGMKILTLDGGKELPLGFDPQRGYSYIVYSADGSRIAASSAGMYCVWDSSTGRMIFQAEETAAGGVNLAISRDGGTVFVMTPDLLKAVSVPSGTVLWEKTAQTNVVTQVHISSDGRYISSSGGINGVFDIATGKVLYEFPASAFSSDSSKVLADEYSGDPHLLVTPAASTWSETASFSEKLYEIPRYTDPGTSISISLSHKAGEIYTTPPGNANRKSAIYTDPDCRYCAHTDYDGFIEVFDISDPAGAKEIYCVAEHCYQSVTDLVFCKELMASCGGFDARCVLFDLEKGQIRYALAGEEYCWGCEMSEDGSKIIMLCGYARDRAFVYSTMTGNLLYSFRSSDGRSIDMIGFTEDGKKVAAVMNDGSAMTGEIYTDIDEMIRQAENR